MLNCSFCVLNSDELAQLRMYFTSNTHTMNDIRNTLRENEAQLVILGVYVILCHWTRVRSVLGRYCSSSQKQITVSKQANSCVHGQVGIKNETNIFPVRTEQAVVQSVICYCGSLEIYEQQSVFLLVSARYKDERKEQWRCSLCHFRRGFSKIIGKKARTRFRLHTKLSSLLLNVSKTGFSEIFS